MRLTKKTGCGGALYVYLFSDRFSHVLLCRDAVKGKAQIQVHEKASRDSSQWCSRTEAEGIRYRQRTYTWLKVYGVYHRIASTRFLTLLVRNETNVNTAAARLFDSLEYFFFKFLLLKMYVYGVIFYWWEHFSVPRLRPLFSDIQSHGPPGISSFVLLNGFD